MKKIEAEGKDELPKPFDFDTFEIKTLEDFNIWNLHAHKAFREAKRRRNKEIARDEKRFVFIENKI